MYTISFDKLTVWKETLQFVKDFCNLTESFPKKVILQ